jgi:DNA-binding NarL/FixJ family response regulator
MNVLIVEDDQLLLRSLESSVLSIRPEAAVRGARSVEGADLEIAKVGPPDFLLLDLGLPDADGFSGLEHFLEVAPKAAIAVVSGASEPEVMRGVFERGAHGFLEKSRDTGQFMKSLRTFFDAGYFAPTVIADLLPSTPSRSLP